MTDKPTLQEFCTELLHEPLTPAWCDVFNVVEGLPAINEDLVCRCTGWSRYVPRPGGYAELTIPGGRRALKTTSSLKYLLFKATIDWPVLTRGKHRRLYVPLILNDQRIGSAVLHMVETYVSASRMMREQVDEIRQREIRLKNGITLIVLAASKASARGLPCPGALLDELAFVVIENANDFELQRAIRPSMIEFGQKRRLIKASTFWKSDGVIVDDFKHRAERPDVVCWQAPTQIMNPFIDPAELEREKAADPVSFEREYVAVLPADGDNESFLVGTDIDAAVRGYRELAPQAGVNYFAAIDASGLSGGDRFVPAFFHKEGDIAVVDCLRSWRKKNPAEVLDEITSLCHAYGVTTIEADQYSFTFLHELFRVRGIELKQLAFSVRSKAEFFFDLKNALAQGRLVLPDVPDCTRELRCLVSQRTSGGAYRIAAPRGLNDDYAACLAIVTNRVKRAARKLWVHDEVARGGHAAYANPIRTDPNDPFFESVHDRWTKI
jgi:hypothetical protein